MSRASSKAVVDRNFDLGTAAGLAAHARHQIRSKPRDRHASLGCYVILPTRAVRPIMWKHDVIHKTGST